MPIKNLPSDVCEEVKEESVKNSTEKIKNTSFLACHGLADGSIF
jgi:hypothetical protein